MKKLKFKGIFFLILIIFLGGDGRGLVGWSGQREVERKF